MPSSRAISAIGRPLVRTNSTASCLNSWVNCRLVLLGLSGIWTASSYRRCPATRGKSSRARRGVTVLRPERGGRSSGCLSGTLRRPPSSESHRRRPLLVPPRSHALYPVVAVTNLTAGARVHPRSVGPSQWHSAQSRKASQGLPYVRRHPVDG